MARQPINFSQPNDGAGDPLRSMAQKSDANFVELYGNKVDKIGAKVLTDVNFSQADKNKLDSLNTNQNPQPNWTQGDSVQPDFIKNKPTKLSQFDNDTDFVVDVTQAGVYGRSADSWVLLNNGSPYNVFKFIQKGFNNIGPQNPPEAGDVYCGWSDDGTIRIHEGLYISGVLTTSNNFKPISQTLL